MAQLSDITDADAFPSLDRDTVSIRMVQARRRELHLTSLKADAEYIVQVQPISTIGVGDAVHRVFMASESDWIPAAIPDNPTLVYHTDDQAVANHNELPMERTSSSSVAISCKLAINSTLLLLLLLLVVNIRL
uniref:Uncharacterized protein n=1 Tax=Plectus sambesii TaxID=2011161 RepID=A0A914UV02_9BILA